MNVPPCEVFQTFSPTLLKDAPIDEIIRVGVKSTIDMHSDKPKLAGSILESIPLLGGSGTLASARAEVTLLVRGAIEERRAEIRSPKNFDIKAFVVVHAVEGVIHDAARERPELLKDPAFAEELVELVDRFLR